MYHRFICTIGLYVLQVYMYYRFICTIGLYVL